MVVKQLVNKRNFTMTMHQVVLLVLPIVQDVQMVILVISVKTITDLIQKANVLNAIMKKDSIGILHS
jgi:hypothetical protein